LKILFSKYLENELRYWLETCCDWGDLQYASYQKKKSYIPRKTKPTEFFEILNFLNIVKIHSSRTNKDIGSILIWKCAARRDLSNAISGSDIVRKIKKKRVFFGLWKKFVKTKKKCGPKIFGVGKFLNGPLIPRRSHVHCAKKLNRFWQ